MEKSAYVRFFEEINNTQVSEVGGKNASLGEMYTRLSSQGVNIPYGFATTAIAYWYFIDFNGIRNTLVGILDSLDLKSYDNLSEVGGKCRELILKATLPQILIEEYRLAYSKLLTACGTDISVAIRSSATAEDLPNASFAGQQESYLNISGIENMLNGIHRCYASLFTDRAIKYREDNGFDHMKVALSACVQQMVRSDLSSAGVGFTMDPETGFDQVHYITGSWGLGENVVQGAVNTDEFYISKFSLRSGKKPVLMSKLGSKAITMIYADIKQEGVFTKNIETPENKRSQFVLNNEELIQLGNWFEIIENHYQRPMDIEWAKDGISGKLYIVQARPETVQSNRNKETKRRDYFIKHKPPILCTGVAVGDRIASGVARVLYSPADSYKLLPGEILVTDITNPDWDPILKKAAAIITDKGGRTSHAAIVAREAGAIAVVGTNNATQKIKDGDRVTVSCAEGQTGVVYQGNAEWTIQEYSISDELPVVSPMFILGDPEKAFELSQWPNAGVGLMRLEFIINNSIAIHPMALVNYPDLKDAQALIKIDQLTAGYSNKEQYFVEKLSQSIATIAAAFYPKPVIVRMSDFKSNEYANLIGGREFEPEEENPMIGFRGASRYYSDRYKKGFKLECEAIKVVRNEMGFTNVKLMIPFCRTVEEGKKVLSIMEEFGLKKGENQLEVYVMAEIPSNVILAEEFAAIFDGFSIGSNDLTQLTLGIDRDSTLVSELFNENNEAVRSSIKSIIRRAKKCGVKIGICGQGPSDSSEFAQFLVEEEIDSISFNPDAYLKGVENIRKAEVVNQKV
jgi:pyruvate,water dikinase